MNYGKLEQKNMMHLGKIGNLQGYIGILLHMEIIWFLNGIVDVGPVSILKRILNATPIKNGLNKYIGKYLGVHSTITSIGVALLRIWKLSF